MKRSAKSHPNDAPLPTQTFRENLRMNVDNKGRMEKGLDQAAWRWCTSLRLFNADFIEWLRVSVAEQMEPIAESSNQIREKWEGAQRTADTKVFAALPVILSTSPSRPSAEQTSRLSSSEHICCHWSCIPTPTFLARLRSSSRPLPLHSAAIYHIARRTPLAILVTWIVPSDNEARGVQRTGSAIGVWLADASVDAHGTELRVGRKISGGSKQRMLLARVCYSILMQCEADCSTHSVSDSESNPKREGDGYSGRR
ncbi:hypothetical protein BLNAU_4719 [Blattamonas nauphoetae]|uniref:ABC transporter domain-containing protein n=1 Tax=Blattamonas nauphoetae TaxID=2049346 RepID=A0ABQ9Y8T6_9EUKA|nr:hypothetical protein BLNAU_4719 [Blattamonas nauphoetae]